MRKNQPYQLLLNRMLVMELTGERLYETLALKTRDANLKSIYQRLACVEYQTSECIRKEMASINKNSHEILNGIVPKFSKFLFCLFTEKQLAWILKTILKRKSYSRWFKVYKDSNQEFWSVLLDHEKLQFELLGITK